MRKINLENLLLAEKQKVINTPTESDDLVNYVEEVNQMLESNTSEDVRLLKQAGFGLALANVKTHKDNIGRKAELANGARLFSEAEIREVACAYGLRFLPSEMYKGSLPPDIISMIKEAMQKNGDECYYYTPSGHGEERQPDFRILAPASSFKLLTPVPVDPVLFLRLKSGLYYLVGKWGNDLSVLRLILNFPIRKPLNVGIWCIPPIVYALVYAIINMAELAKGTTKPDYVVLMLASAIAFFIFLFTNFGLSNTNRWDSKFE